MSGIPQAQLIDTQRDRQIGEPTVIDAHPLGALLDVARHAERAQ
jgi:hypothetical protein